MSQFFENSTKTGSPVPNFECTSMRTPIQPRPETLWQPRLRPPVSPASFPLFFVDFSKMTILMHTEPLNDCLPKVASRMPQSGLKVAKEHVLFLDQKSVLLLLLEVLCVGQACVASRYKSRSATKEISKKGKTPRRCSATITRFPGHKKEATKSQGYCRVLDDSKALWIRTSDRNLVNLSNPSVFVLIPLNLRGTSNKNQAAALESFGRWLSSPQKDGVLGLPFKGSVVLHQYGEVVWHQNTAIPSTLSSHEALRKSEDIWFDHRWSFLATTRVKMN